MVGPQESRRIPGEPLSPKEIRAKTRRIFIDYALKSSHILNPMVRDGQGRASLGSVPGRPNDEQLAIDAIGENILTSLIRDHGLPALVLGEHNTYDFSDGKPEVIFPIDAFDNTSEYKRGLDTPVYSVIGAYNPDGSPIGAVIVDIREQKAFASVRKENYILDVSSPNMPSHMEKMEPTPTRGSIKDDGLTIATYLGSNEYSLKFFNFFGRMVKDMPEKARIYANGGSFIYAFLATGAVDAYVMFDEPHSEIVTGLPIALAAGCTAVSVNPDGSHQEYKFDPEFADHPERYTHGTVPLFIAARTPKIRNEIIEYYARAIRTLTTPWP
ncbi:hypothetical protein M1146_02930 [Patescibacteria group bacterium]|nr:hypothetical protein [Patescibacteria group bacterium]